MSVGMAEGMQIDVIFTDKVSSFVSVSEIEDRSWFTPRRS